MHACMCMYAYVFGLLGLVVLEQSTHFLLHSPPVTIVERATITITITITVFAIYTHDRTALARPSLPSALPPLDRIDVDVNTSTGNVLCVCGCVYVCVCICACARARVHCVHVHHRTYLLAQALNAPTHASLCLFIIVTITSTSTISNVVIISIVILAIIHQLNRESMKHALRRSKARCVCVCVFYRSACEQCGE